MNPVLLLGWNLQQVSAGTTPLVPREFQHFVGLENVSLKIVVIAGKDGEVSKGHKDLLRMKNLHSDICINFLICVKKLQNQGRTTKGHGALFG